MNAVLSSGRYLFAIAIGGFGLEHFIFARSHFLADILPYTANGPLTAWLIGAGLIVVSLSLASGTAARLLGRWFAGALILDFLIVHVPRMAGAPADAGLRTRGFETLSIAAITLVLAPALGGGQIDRRQASGAGLLSVWTTAQIGRFLFAIALAIFGIQHFMLIPFIASLIPAWMPGRVFLAYFTGASFIAAALAFAAGKLTRLAGVLLAAMFLIWVVTLHAPRVAHAIANGDEWCSMLIAVAMAAGGLVVAGTSGARDRPAQSHGGASRSGSP
jgi:uncharacterized membrane protein YphA (DoxX/SURF4 family)